MPAQKTFADFEYLVLALETLGITRCSEHRIRAIKLLRQGDVFMKPEAMEVADDQLSRLTAEEFEDAIYGDGDPDLVSQDTAEVLAWVAKMIS